MGADPPIASLREEYLSYLEERDERLFAHQLATGLMAAKIIGAHNEGGVSYREIVSMMNETLEQAAEVMLIDASERYTEASVHEFLAEGRAGFEEAVGQIYDVGEGGWSSDLETAATELVHTDVVQLLNERAQRQKRRRGQDGESVSDS